MRTSKIHMIISYVVNSSAVNKNKISNFIIETNNNIVLSIHAENNNLQAFTLKTNLLIAIEY